MTWSPRQDTRNHEHGSALVAQPDEFLHELPSVARNRSSSAFVSNSDSAWQFETSHAAATSHSASGSVRRRRRPLPAASLQDIALCTRWEESAHRGSPVGGRQLPLRATLFTVSRCSGSVAMSAKGKIVSDMDEHGSMKVNFTFL
jgi:hypothetical protein